MTLNGLDITHLLSCPHNTYELRETAASIVFNQLVNRLHPVYVRQCIVTTDCCRLPRRNFVFLLLDKLIRQNCICRSCLMIHREELYQVIISYLKESITVLNHSGTFNKPSPSRLDHFLPAISCTRCLRFYCHKHWKSHGTSNVCDDCFSRYIKETGINVKTIPMLTKEMRRVFRLVLLLGLRLGLPNEICVQIGLHCL